MLELAYAVANPTHAGSARALAGLRAAASGFELRVLTTEPGDPGRGQARAALDAGARLVVGVGGDGTMRVLAGVLAGTGVPLGVVPTGAANLFALNLGLRRRDAATTALSGRPRRVDVGWAAHRIGGAWADEEPFLIVAGLGQDAATVAATRPHLKRRIGWLAYLDAGARRLSAPGLPLTIRVDAEAPRAVTAWSVLAGNCGRLPAGVRVFPGARVDDGVLDTLIARVDRPAQWAWVAAKGLGLRREVAPLTYGAASRIELIPDAPAPVQLDGDVIAGVEAARWRVEPGALLTMAPPPGVRGGKAARA